MGKHYFVYILMNKYYSTMYIGVTNNISRRINEHKTKTTDSFSNRYNTNILVYYEVYPYVYDAIHREKKLKKWKRIWKEELIRSSNPKLEDLSKTLPYY
ncbi:MAG: GIY-YIG nuclease family protein [Candidatus Dojkabacteria bacterium]